MIEQVLNRRNIMQAYRQVVSNKGSAGVDGMSVKELYVHLTKNREQIESDIRAGKYLPQAIKGVEIPKSNGKKRPLSIAHRNRPIAATSRWSGFGHQIRDGF